MYWINQWTGYLKRENSNTRRGSSAVSYIEALNGSNCYISITKGNWENFDNYQFNIQCEHEENKIILAYFLLAKIMMNVYINVDPEMICCQVTASKSFALSLLVMEKRIYNKILGKQLSKLLVV